MITYLKKTKYGNVETFSGEAGDMVRDRDRLYKFQTGKIILIHYFIHLHFTVSLRWHFQNIPINNQEISKFKILQITSN